MKKLFFLHSLLAVSLAALFYTLYFYFPVQYVYAVDEDSWTEYSTFVFYIMSSVTLSWIIWRYKGYRKPGIIILMLMTTVIAFEEISWGQRIFDVATPWRLSRINLQHEFNLHNIEVVQSKLQYVSYCMFAWVFVMPFLCRKWTLLNSFRDRFGFPLVPVYLWPYFFVLAYLMIDSTLFHVQEPFEVLLSFTCVMFVYDMLIKIEQEEEIKRGWKRSVIFFGIIPPMMIACLVYFFPWPWHLQWRFKQLTRVYQKRGLDDQAEIVFEYLYNTPSLQGKSTLDDYALFLLRTGREQKALVVLSNDLKLLNSLKKANTNKE